MRADARAEGVQWHTLRPVLRNEIGLVVIVRAERWLVSPTYCPTKEVLRQAGCGAVVGQDRRRGIA
jgi:hypothetical protein